MCERFLVLKRTSAQSPIYNIVLSVVTIIVAWYTLRVMERVINYY